MANVAFIYTIGDLAAIKHTNIKLLPLTSKLKVHLASNKIEYKNYEDYFPGKLSKKLNMLASKWSASWDKDINVEFANSLRLSLHNYFAEKLFQLACIDNLIKTELPAEVYLGKKAFSYKYILASNFEDITEVIKLVCGKKAVRLIDRSGKSIWPLKYFVKLILPPRLRGIKIKSRVRGSIILAAHHYHVINIIPFLLSLKQSRLRPLVVGRVGEAAKSLKDNKLEKISFYGEISFKDLPRYLIVKLKLLLKLNKFLQKKRLFSYHGYNLWNVLKPKLISLFLSDALNFYAHKLFYNKLLYRFEPSQVITVTNDFSNQSLTNLAKTMRIPTMEIQHGITMGADGTYLKVDKLAVWGKIPSYIYSKHGVDSKRLVISGWPGYETYLTEHFPITKINPKNLTISFLAQDPAGMSLLFMNRTPEENIRIFFKAMSMLGSGIKAVVRLHPRADKSLSSVLAKKYLIKFRLSENETLKDLLVKTDIVVGQTTSATLDAIIMHKPVIYLPSMTWATKFVEGSGAVWEAKNANDIEKIAKLIIKNGMNPAMLECQDKFIQDYCNFPNSSVDLLSKQIRVNIDAKN